MTPRTAPSIPWRQSTVLLDFDGTVSQLDVSDYLLNKFAPSYWQEINERYLAGRIGSRENNQALWKLLPHDMGLLFRAAQEVKLDPDFRRLVALLTTSGAEVVVASDGFGFYVWRACDELPIRVVAANVTDGKLTFPHTAEQCVHPARPCGTCKPMYLRKERARGRFVVLIGDGVSDRYAAKEAQYVYAKGSLARWCTASDVPRQEFESFADILDHSQIGRNCA